MQTSSYATDGIPEQATCQMLVDGAIHCHGPLVSLPSVPRSLIYVAPDAFRNDKAAIERLIEQVQGEAMRAIPGVQLPSNNVQVLVDGVRAGPAGWKWSSTPAQGLATAQVRMGN